MYQNEIVRYHAQLALEHRSMASYAASAAVQRYHAIMAEHHNAKAFGMPPGARETTTPDAR